MHVMCMVLKYFFSVKTWWAKFWHVIHSQDLAFQVLKLVGFNNFEEFCHVFHDLAFQDMNTHENNKQTWHLQFFHVSSFKMLYFCNSMPPSLDNDCTIQDLVAQVLNFWGNNFNIRPIISWLNLPRHGQDLALVWNLCSRLGMPSFNMLHFCTSMPKSWQWLIQDLAFQVLKLLGVNNFDIIPK